jgi:hypothetical protein
MKREPAVKLERSQVRATSKRQNNQEFSANVVSMMCDLFGNVGGDRATWSILVGGVKHQVQRWNH